MGWRWSVWREDNFVREENGRVRGESGWVQQHDIAGSYYSCDALDYSIFPQVLSLQNMND